MCLKVPNRWGHFAGVHFSDRYIVCLHQRVSDSGHALLAFLWDCRRDGRPRSSVVDLRWSVELDCAFGDPDFGFF
jgi:hypothetical protein